MWELLFSWTVVGIVVVVLLTTAQWLVSMAQPHPVAAQIIYTASALILMGRVGWWVAFEQAPATKWGQALSVLFIVFGLVGCFWYVGVRWVRTTFDTRGSKLGFSSSITLADYPTNTTLAGIPWSSRFTDCRLTITNGSGTEFTDLDLSLEPDQLVALASQITNVPDVALSPSTDMTFTMEAREATGTRKANPLDLIATNRGYRLRCPRLGSKQTIEVVFGLVEMAGFTNGRPITAKQKKTPLPDLGVFERDYVLRIGDDKTHKANYYGHGPDSRGRVLEVFRNAKVVAKSIKLKGSYSVAQDERHVDETVVVHDLIEEAMPAIMKDINSKQARQ